MDPSTEYLKHMTRDSVAREGDDAIHNPAPKGVSEKRYKKVKEAVAGKARNKYALAAWITKREKGLK